MLTMTDPRGGVTTLAYDTSSRATSWTDPMKHTTTFSYAGNGGGSQTTTELTPAATSPPGTTRTSSSPR